MDRTSIIYISAEVVVGVASALGNSIVLLAILRTPRLHTVTNVFVGNLAIADIAVGFLVAPLAALAFEGLPKDFYGCVVVNSLILLFTNVSIFMLLAVALERFIAIKEPFTYQRLMTVGRAIKINLAVWLLGSLLGLVPLYGWNSGNKDMKSCQFTAVITYPYMVYFQFFGLVLLPLSLMLGIYIYILIIVRRHSRQTHALHRHVQHNAVNGDVRQRAGETSENRKFNKDVRAAKMFALLIFLFGVFWLPVNIFNCLSLFCHDKCKFTFEALLVAIVMSHANSCINPLIYAASNSRIKRAIKVMFGIKSAIEASNTDINNEGRTTNGVTANRTVAKDTVHAANTYNTHDRLSPISMPNDIFTVNPGRAVEMEENEDASNVSARYYTSLETNSLPRESPQTSHGDAIRRAGTTQQTIHRRTSLPNFATCSANTSNAQRSLSLPSRPWSARQSHSPVHRDTQPQEIPPRVGLFCVEPQISEQALDQSESHVHSTQYDPCKYHNPVYQDRSLHQNTFLHLDVTPTFVSPEVGNRTYKNAIEASASYNDSEHGTYSDLNHVHIENCRHNSTQYDNGIDTETSKRDFQLEDVTFWPPTENRSVGETSHSNTVLRTSGLLPPRLPLNGLELDLTSEDTNSSFGSRAKLKSPSLFSTQEENNMAKNKWTEHTKL